VKLLITGRIVTASTKFFARFSHEIGSFQSYLKLYTNPIKFTIPHSKRKLLYQSITHFTGFLSNNLIISLTLEHWKRSSNYGKNHEIFISRVLAIIKIRSISYKSSTYPLPENLSSTKKGSYIEEVTEAFGIAPTTYYYRKHSIFLKKRNPV